MLRNLGYNTLKEKIQYRSQIQKSPSGIIRRTFFIVCPNAKSTCPCAKIQKTTADVTDEAPQSFYSPPALYGQSLPAPR
jgi:hypothetical protein